MDKHTPTHTKKCYAVDGGRSCYCERSLMLCPVPESATHIGFINGKTYSKEEILTAVNAHEELLGLLKTCLDHAQKRYGAILPEFYEQVQQAIVKAEGK